MGYPRYRLSCFRVKPGGRTVANKETGGENKAFEEIERLAKEQASKDTKKTKEAEAKSKKGADKLDKEKAKKETKEAKKAKKEADKLAKEQAKKEAEEAKKAKKEAEKLAKEQAKKEAEEAKKAKKEAKGGKPTKKEPTLEASSATYQGSFQLVLPPSAGFKQVRRFSASLADMADLKVVWTGGSADEGALIAISVAEPVPLARILSDMPMVEGVEFKGEKIHVNLKSSA
jgi:septal ring factor EnvC (AmiA/AmiB activator)